VRFNRRLDAEKPREKKISQVCIYDFIIFYTNFIFASMGEASMEASAKKN
jgi:hypothetical protein